MLCQFLQDIGPARGHHHPRPSLGERTPGRPADPLNVVRPAAWRQGMAV